MNIYKRPIKLEGALAGVPSTSLWLSHMQTHAAEYALGVFSVFCTNITEVAIPKIVQHTLDVFTIAAPTLNRIHEAHRFFWIFVGVVVVQFIGRIGWRLTLGQQTHLVAARMKSLLWDRARYFPRARLDNDLTPGELMNVATGDVGTSRFVFGFTLVGTTDFMFLLVFTTLAMLSIDVELTLWSLGILPVLPFFLDKLARTESRQHKDAQASLSSLTDLASQAVSTVRLQRVSQTGPFWEKKLRASADDYRGKRFDVVKTGLAFIPITGVAPLISYLLLLLIGVKKVVSGDLTIGSFVAMQSYIFMIQGPMIELGVIISEWQRCFTSLDRVTNIWAQPEAEGLRSGGRTPVMQNTVFEVEALNFKYPGSSQSIVRNVNFNLRRGERLGIKGPIGTGKSTLLQILSGFERNFEGSVKLLGDDIRNYSHSELRKWIAVVPQKPFLFADTIRNNLALNRSCSDEEIWRLLSISGLDEDVRGFTDGLNTKLGEWGINLSGGQKQRLTLARALAAKPSILLLDDCLSAVDTLTEEKILSNLDREIKDLTAVWVAHRSSTLRYCDQFLEMHPS